MIVQDEERVAAYKKRRRAEKIMQANDEFRRTVVEIDMEIWSGVREIEDPIGVLEAVRTYDDFAEDPNGDHAFGMFPWHGETVVWRIDYHHSELTVDPLSPTCTRGLVVFLESELDPWDRD